MEQGSLNKKTLKNYPPVLSETDDWPVVKMARNREAFIKEVVQRSFENLKKHVKNNEELIEEIETTVYREKLRSKKKPWRVDPEDEVYYWNNIQEELVDISNQKEEDNEKQLDVIVYKIIERYANEIAGNFKKSRYRFARKILKWGFSRLLNASMLGGIGSFLKDDVSLLDKLQIHGEAEHIRKMATKGTVIMVPTHFSNLDSALIGFIIHILGLPAFIYGAGLNLFNIGIFAYFANSLGAYKVDRRKKNRLYLETLTTYSTLAIKKGSHSLFFPGGTRSRSGRIEENLKLGLLSSAMEAQRLCVEEAEGDKYQKIFVFPVVINYHFVLEAPSLIQEYLKTKGQERFYVDKDEYTTSYKTASFLLKFFTKGSSISVSIGKGMDLFGHYVDDEGNSLSKTGNKIDIKEYFMYDGVIKEDSQREYQYSMSLGKIIVEEYHRLNRVFSSHLAAFTAFVLILKKHKQLDLYNILRLPEEDLIIDYKTFAEAFDKVRQEVFNLKKLGKIDHASHIVGELDEVIDHGISNVGMYHAKRPLAKNNDGNIMVQDATVLYYYHNRLKGYDLSKLI
ncbi:MAG: 1-acyl-sn-glycerol-3-phosphate acyltransferase [Bacteroidota bacterium]